MECVIEEKFSPLSANFFSVTVYHFPNMTRKVCKLKNTDEVNSTLCPLLARSHMGYQYIQDIT